MALHRFYLPPTQWMAKLPVLDTADSHHCAEVLRLGLGGQVTVFDGEGHEASAEIVEMSRKQTRLSVGPAKTTAKPSCVITLAQAVPKGKNMELVIQKAVELGALKITPILSERTIVRIEDAAEALRKQERWQTIAIEACKQCGQNWLPEIALPRKMPDFLSQLPKADLILIASLQPRAKAIKAVLAEDWQKRGTFPGSVIVMIGPEGDFTADETAKMQAVGAIPITLGSIILRTETAALYCLSVLSHELF